MTTATTNQEFQKLIRESTVPCLVDFWAEWCGPCRMIAPILEEIAEEYQGKINVIKVNVDDSPELAQQYEIMSIPTLIIFKGGREQERIVGAIPKEMILSKVLK